MKLKKFFVISFGLVASCGAEPPEKELYIETFEKAPQAAIPEETNPEPEEKPENPVCTDKKCNMPNDLKPEPSPELKPIKDPEKRKKIKKRIENLENDINDLEKQINKAKLNKKI